MPAASLPQTVICTALNFRATADALASQFTADPYKQPPKAPILYPKPPNTYNAPGATIVCPRGTETLRMGGTLGIVMGRNACRLTPANALDFVRGYAVLNDVSVPHVSYYRPAIKERCRDGFLVIGPEAARSAITDPNALAIRMFVNGQFAAENSAANLVRGVERLLVDVTEFLTLAEGDILCVGEPDNAPLARPGDRVRIEIPGIGSVENSIAAEASI